MILENILGAIGGTPIVALDALCKKHKIDGQILAKVEFLSPGFSKKDRIAKYMIERAEEEGYLRQGQTIIEATSGNTGIALAMVCAVKGYPFVAVMSDGNSIERVKLMENFGARVELVPRLGEAGQVSGDDLARVTARFDELAEELGAFKVGQFTSEENLKAHQTYTAEEILAGAGKFHAFADFVGTGGSFEGIAKRLKEHDSKISCLKIIPATICHTIQGGGYHRHVPFSCETRCDGEIVVDCNESAFWRRELAITCGIAGGLSTGANLAGCVKWLRENPGKTIAMLVNDSYLNYLSTHCA